MSELAASVCEAATSERAEVVIHAARGRGVWVILQGDGDLTGVMTGGTFALCCVSQPMV